MPDINIELPDNDEVTDLADKVEDLENKLDEIELEQKIEEVLEEKLEETLEEVAPANDDLTDKVAALETVIVALDQKLMDLEEVVIAVEEEFEEETAENNLEHQELATEVAEVAEEETQEDKAPPHAGQHILFADGKELSERLKAWWSR